MIDTIQQEALDSKGFQVIFGGRIYTASEMKDESEQVAANLIKAGIGPGKRVALQMSRSYELICAMTGVFATGAAVIMLSKDIPESRYDFIIDDAAPDMIITDEAYKELKKPGCVFDVSRVKKAEINDTALIIYTSGSTGVPKGVLHTQKSFGKIAGEINRNFKEEVRDAAFSAALTDATFISFFIFEYGFCLTGNKCMKLMAEDEMNSPAELAGVLDSDEKFVIFMTPSKYTAMAESDSVRQALSKEGILFFAGEKLSEALEEKVKNYYPENLAIVDAYGSTECGLISGRDIRSGRCLEFTPYKIIAEEKEGGGPGETGVDNDYIFKDYSASGIKKTVTIDGREYFLTGDLGVYGKDGCLLIQGRNDRMIKYNGLRIELDGLTEVLKGCKDVRNAAVVYSKEHNRIAAFYEADHKTETRILRKEMSRRVPFFMLPHSFTYISSIPVTSHGKTDYQKLIRMFDEDFAKPWNTAVESKVDEIRTDLEKILCRIVKDITGADASLDASCMELEIDSLKALRVISGLGERKLTVSLKDIMLSSSLRDLALCIKDKKADSVPKETCHTDRLPVLNEYHKFLINAEISGNDMMAMWIKDSFIGKASYDAESFKERIELLVRRHPVLTSAFLPYENGEFIQSFGEAFPHVSFLDIRNDKDESVETHIEDYENRYLKELEEKEGRRECAFACFRLDDERCAFHIKISHVISDGMSQQILINELLAASLPDEEDAYFAYQTWIRDEGNKNEALEFFKGYVEGADYACVKELVEGPPAMPGMPPMPGPEGMPGMPGMPPMPGLEGMPGMPPMPGPEGMPGMPPMPGLEGMPGMPPMPDLEGMPGMPQMQDMNDASGFPPMPAFDGMPLMSFDNNITKMVSIGKTENLTGMTPFIYVLYRYANALINTFDKDRIVFYITSSGRNIPVDGMDKVVGDLSCRMPVVIEKGQDADKFMEGVYQAENHLCITPEEIWTEKDPVNFPILVSEVFPDYTEGKLLQRIKEREFDPLGINAYFLEENGEMFIRISYNPMLKDEATYEKFIDLLESGM